MVKGACFLAEARFPPLGADDNLVVEAGSSDDSSGDSALTELLVVFFPRPRPRLVGVVADDESIVGDKSAAEATGTTTDELLLLPGPADGPDGVEYAPYGVTDDTPLLAYPP